MYVPDTPYRGLIGQMRREYIKYRDLHGKGIHFNGGGAPRLLIKDSLSRHVATASSSVLAITTVKGHK